MCVMMTKEQLAEFDAFMAKQKATKAKVYQIDEYGSHVHFEMNNEGYRQLKEFREQRRAA